MNNLFIITN